MRKRYVYAALFAVLLAALLLTWRHFHSTEGPAPLALQACDPAGYVPCAQQEAFASIPVVDTGVYLTYSSRWIAGPSGRPTWDASGLGLGGWSINFVQRYDKSSRLFISGDGSWRLTDSVALPSGGFAVPSYDGSLAYIFDSSGRHIRTLDGHLGTELLKVSYDGAGRLAKADGFIDGQPVHVTVRRDANGQPQALVGTDGGVTTLKLDGESRVVGVVDPAGQATNLTWNAAGLVESETDPAGGVMHLAYDPSGRLTTLTDADGVTRQFDYRSSSNTLEVSVSSAQGRHWTYRAESTDGSVRRTYVAQDGSTTTEVIDAHGARSLQLPDGTAFNVGAAANPVWGMAAPILTPVVESRPDGVTSRRETKYALQPQNGLPYELAGSVTTTINGADWVQDFAPAQRTATLVDPAGRRTTAVYDAQGRLIDYSAPGVAPISETYTAEGRSASVTVGAGELAHTTHYAYDASVGQVIVTRPDDTTLKFAVDATGQTVSAAAGDGSTVLTNYDAAGRLIQLQPPGGLDYTLGNTPAGRGTGFAAPMVPDDASVETAAYDKDGELAAISGPGPRAVDYEYDSGGRVVASTFDQGKAGVSYDAQSGLRSRTTDPSGVTTSYAYAGSTLDSLVWSGPVNGSVSVKLDANGRVTREDVDGAQGLDFAYDEAGNLTGIGPLSLTRDGATGLVTREALGAVETQQAFDRNGLLSRSTTTANGKVLLDDRYTRDTFGRIKSVTEVGSNGKTSSTEYSYDRADRLASVRVDGRVVETDTYDPAGNRISVARASGDVTAKFDVRNRALTWGGTQYSWAPDGALASRADAGGATTFAYDDFGALRGATLADGRAIKYLVDADGRRVGREIGGNLVAEYLYRLDGSIAAEADSAGKVTSRFGYDDRGHLAFVVRDGVTYRVITDAVGSPRLIIDSRSGTLAEEISYDAWGNVVQDTAPGFSPVGFAGGLRDTDTGLVRFGARDYDPVTGRWTAADPIRFDGGDSNLYGYAGSDPVNAVDRSGLFIGPVVGAGNVLLLGAAPVAAAANIAVVGAIPLGIGAGIGYGAAYLIDKRWQQLNQPDSPGNGPGNGNPPGNGGTPPNNDPIWNCASATGTCTSPDNLPNSNPVVPKWGCRWGECGNNGKGFWCKAGWCWGPKGDLCKAAIGATCSYGEPHLRTEQGLEFDFQAAGEFLVLSGADGRVVIQARQQQLGDLPVAINTAVAADVNGDRVGVYAKEPSFLMINDLPVAETDTEKRLPNGGTLVRHGSVVEITWPDGGRLNVTRAGDALTYGYGYDAGQSAPAMRGLLGSFGAKSSTDLVARDGNALSRLDPDFYSKVYREVGDSWRIEPSESLFHYWSGESTATFTDPSMPSRLVAAGSLSSEVHSRAEAVCRAFGVRAQPTLDNCILDVGLTGMPAYATASAGISQTPLSYRVVNTSAGSPSTSASGPVSSGSAALATDQYAINIGDTVSQDRPSAGAGTIRSPGGQQSYLFSAAAGAIVYVKVGPCEGVPPTFDLRNPKDDVIGGTIGCGDFGPVTLPSAGTYRIVTRSEGAASYAFSLRAAAFDQYSIKIGDTVSPDQPSPGAGTITSLGQRQSYGFKGRAGQTVYIGLGPCAPAEPSFSILKPDDTLLDGTIGNCRVAFREVLPVTGTYRIVASTDKSNVASRYSFFVHEVPADQRFAARLPLNVSPGTPTGAAGRITTEGAQQFFDFTASPGTVVHIQSKCSCSRLWIRAVAVDDGSNGGYRDLDPGFSSDWVLPRGGKYTIQVRSNGYTGDYGFAASVAPPQGH